MSTVITVVTAPAKLTVSLRVTGRRADGYHLIDAEMVTVDLADTVTIDPTATPGVEYRGPRAGGVTAGGDDLVTRALALVGRSARVVVDKMVPAGAGLGGGSADAAAVLRWAGWTGRGDELPEAAGLGADVAFCLVGGRARVTGIGEVVEPLDVEERTFTLLVPPVHCSTPAVYAAWDELGGPVGEHGNDLEAAAVAVAPELARHRDRLAELTGLRPRLAGSGSTWFVEGAHPGPGLQVVRTVPGDAGRPRPRS